jgi:hypothetical protein
MSVWVHEWVTGRMYLNAGNDSVGGGYCGDDVSGDSLGIIPRLELDVKDVRAQIIRSGDEIHRKLVILVEHSTTN